MLSKTAVHISQIELGTVLRFYSQLPENPVLGPCNITFITFFGWAPSLSKSVTQYHCPTNSNNACTTNYWLKICQHVCWLKNTKHFIVSNYTPSLYLDSMESNIQQAQYFSLMKLLLKICISTPALTLQPVKHITHDSQCGSINTTTTAG